MLEDRTEAGLADLAVLAEPVRRRVYLHVLRRADAVSRDEAAAELFAEALSAPRGGSTDLGDVARTYGTELGTEARRRAGPRARPQRRLEALATVLRDAGYVPFE